MKTENVNDPIPEDLRALVELGLSEARRQMDATGEMQPTFVFRLADGSTRQHKLPEELGEIMNNGPAKDLLFTTMRLAVAMQGATAFVSVVDTWAGIPTEKQLTMTREELVAFAATGASLAEFERAGLVRRVEALTVVAQTAAEVVVVRQCYERVVGGTVRFGERETQHIPQKHFRGRMKMFGVKPGEDPGRDGVTWEPQ